MPATGAALNPAGTTGSSSIGFATAAGPHGHGIIARAHCNPTVLKEGFAGYMTHSDRPGPAWGSLPIVLWERVLRLALCTSTYKDELNLASLGLLIKASTVCRDLAEAALYVIRSMDGLDICCSYYPNNYWVQLDSRLLLEWAPLISGCVRLHGNSILTPGLPAFCEAGAGTMHSLHVSTYADLPHAHLPYQFDVSLGLPELRVNLEIDLDDWTFLNLNWLQFQPRIVLTVILRINTDLVTKHEHATRELRHTPLHNLTMIWQVLQALPRCGNICIRTSIPFAQIELDWAAVTSQAARISLCMPSAILSILGGFSIPDDLGGAWQLTVHEADSVNGQGLQGACVIGTDHILQNAAAVAAGWTVDGVEVRDHAAQPCLACALHACCLGVI